MTAHWLCIKCALQGVACLTAAYVIWWLWYVFGDGWLLKYAVAMGKW